MYKLLWIGSPFFSKSLPRCGWDLYFHNFEQTAVFTWPDLIKLSNGQPDVLVVADKSRPPFVLGMEKFPCLTVFYCVDSHIHSYYPYYAQGFDLCLVSLKDHMDKFAQKRLPADRIIHSPPFAKDEDQPLDGSKKVSSIINPSEKWDLLFVGTVNPRTTPQRRLFLNELKKKIPGLHIMQGKYRELYPKAKIVFNYSEFGDLNFRVFEALGCGACLLTPMVNHGFCDMFTPSEDLFTYQLDSVKDAAAQANYLLQHPELCLRAAKSGLTKINSQHRAIHRAQNFTNHILGIIPNRETTIHTLRQANSAFQPVIADRIKHADIIHQQYLRFIYLLLAEKEEEPLLKEMYLKAAKNII